MAKYQTTNTDSLTDEQQECINIVNKYNFLELTKEEWRTNRGFILAALKKDGKILGDPEGTPLEFN